jgi:hypothetical protein
MKRIIVILIAVALMDFGWGDLPGTFYTPFRKIPVMARDIHYLGYVRNTKLN